ncbi:hypothetical protein [Methylobacterium segetis]|uniref:hypothetical protein n=1 Tax=Methylobacterium segetis TaxID=2488750 RepID=UPI00104D97DC|nr:hypothetical protein [Methylobacterium segetis]
MLDIFRSKVGSAGRRGGQGGSPKPISLLACSVSALALIPTDASAQAPGLIDVCAGLGVRLPQLQSVGAVTPGLPLGLNTVLDGLVNGLNQNVVAPLSDVTLRVGVLDANGNLASVASPGGCNLRASTLSLDASRGVAIGAGRVSGLGNLTAIAPSAGAVSAVAIGDGAVTAVGSHDALALGNGAAVTGGGGIALGLRGRVEGDDGMAMGTDAAATSPGAVALGARSTATVAGAVALGAGTIANRVALGGGSEAFTGTIVTSTSGAVSVGAVGAERQITNVAGGTLPTDAVNLRQLASVGGNLAASLGGGAAFDPTTGRYTPPTFTVQGTGYATVSGAIGALDGRIGANAAAITTLGTDLGSLRSGLDGGTIGLVRQDPASRTLTVGAGTDGTTLNIAGTAGNRRVTGLSAGLGASDAVTLAQLDAAVTVFGSGLASRPVAATNESGRLPAAATGTDALALGFGTTAAAAHSVALGNGSVAAEAGTVSVGTSGAERRIVHVSAGTLAVGSADAVTGGQLFATNQQLAQQGADTARVSVALGHLGTAVAASLGGGSRYDAMAGTWSAPDYRIRGSSYADVGSALGAVDLALVRTASGLDAVAQQVASLQSSSVGGATGGGTGLVQQPAPGAPVAIGRGTGGSSVDVSGTEGPRRISGVASGVAPSDAATVGQLGQTAQAFEARLKDFPVRGNNSRGAAAPSASGRDAYASGYGAAASGTGSVAVGSDATAHGLETTGLGTDSAATADRSTAIGARSVASGTDSAAFGQGSLAAAMGATAIGTGSQATWEGATAIGTGARAVADPTTAVGYQALAGGNEASAFGAYASATGDDSTALGRSATASAAGATAVGVGASAQGADSLSLGRGARASQANAIAIGAGVATTRAGQVAVGSERSTYTLAGLGTAASRAAQTGATRFVTADANGNLALAESGPANLAGLQNQIGALGAQINGLGQYAAASRREARQGIAAAMASTAASMPSQPGRTTWALNGATFRGEWAGGLALAHRLDTSIPIALTAGYSYSQSSSQGVRAGLAGEF